MVIAVSVLLVATLIAVPGCGFVLVRRMLRAAGPVREGQLGRPVPFGGLADLGPVGELGDLSPSATIGDPTASPHDLFER